MWTLKFSATATKQLKKLDKPLQQKILGYLQNRLSPRENPRTQGKPLTGDMRHFWRYRVGDYRIICDIEDSTITILVLRIAHRKEVYLKSAL